MTGKITIFLALLIAIFFVLDHYVLHLNAAVFLGKRMIRMIEYLAIWR